MVAVSIWSGPAEVIATGTLTTFGANGAYFVLPFGAIPFEVGIQFYDDPAVEGPTVRGFVQPKGALLHLVNFGGIDGRGSAEPGLLGEDADHLLMWHFRVFRYGRTIDHTLHYTFYRVAKVDVAWEPVVRPEGPG